IARIAASGFPDVIGAPRGGRKSSTWNKSNGGMQYGAGSASVAIVCTPAATNRRKSFAAIMRVLEGLSSATNPSKYRPPVMIATPTNSAIAAREALVDLLRN